MPSNFTTTTKDRHLSDFGNYRRDLAVLETSSSPRGHPTQNYSQPTNQVAPWMTPPGSLVPNTSLGNFYDDAVDNMSLASQISPALGPTTSRIGQNNGISASFDSNMIDSMYLNDSRRPSAASINTASSQGSKTSGQRGGLRKLQGFFGEEFPGRESPEGSLSNSLSGGAVGSNTPQGHSNTNSKELRSRSYSHTRPPYRDRNFSNATDREASPASSRPRTPVPAPEVVPFLYQDNTVC